MLLGFCLKPTKTVILRMATNFLTSTNCLANFAEKGAENALLVFKEMHKFMPNTDLSMFCWGGWERIFTNY